MVLVLPFAKILATSLSIGSGGSGGIFGPGMFIGGMLGAGIWRLLEPIAPGDPGRPGAVRDRRDDGAVRQRRPRPARGDADGRRDDRQPLDARSGDGRGRPRDVRRRDEDRSTGASSRRGPTRRPTGSASRCRCSRRSRWAMRPARRAWSCGADDTVGDGAGPDRGEPACPGRRSSAPMARSWAWSTSTSLQAAADDERVGAVAIVARADPRGRRRPR